MAEKKINDDKYKDGIYYNKKHFTPLNWRRFNDAIIDKGTCYEEVVGFIDGTLEVICRLTEYQEVTYSGHIKDHAQKYQAIVCPDGITASLYGPFAGSMHDSGALHKSNILRQLNEQLDCRETDGIVYALYGDVAYRECRAIIKTFQNARTADERGVNLVMSRVQICVEWEFGHVMTLFAYLHQPGKWNKYVLRVPSLKQYIEEVTPE